MEQQETNDSESLQASAINLHLSVLLAVQADAIIL